MAFSQSAPTTSDVIKDYLASFVAKVVAFLNAIPGGNLSDGTVTNAKLAKAKAHFSWNACLNGGATLSSTSTTNVWMRKVPYLDGASSATFRITGWSFASNTVTKGSGNQLLIKVDGVTEITIDLNDANLDSGDPIQSAAGMTLESLTSGQVVSVDYTYGGSAGSYSNPQLDIDLAAVHVSGV